jgi:hypothetical protein
MTAGQWLFYGGIALLGVTVLLAGLFWLKRPRGAPGNRFPGTDTDLGERKGGAAADDPVTVFDEVNLPDGEAPDTVYDGQTVLPGRKAAGDSRTVLPGAATELLPNSGGEPFPGDGAFLEKDG